MVQYQWYNTNRRNYIDRFRNYLDAGGTSGSKRKAIDEHVLKKVKAARDSNRSVHGYMIRRWAQECAEEINATAFVGSDSWVERFKQRHSIVGRKVTDIRSRPEVAQAEMIEESRRRFLQEYDALRHYFPRHLIWNFDQSGFRYEISNDRTLTFRGDRNVGLQIDSQNKNRHSYTIQVTIARDGSLVGKMLICLYENDNEFGVRVKKQVDEIVEKLGNVMVVANKSGKMTREHIVRWIDEGLLPLMRSSLRPADGETIVDSQQSSQNSLASASSEQCRMPDPGAGPS